MTGRAGRALTSGLPAGAGSSLKHQHYADVRASPVLPAFFEVHAENYLGAGGPGHHMLRWVRERTALSIHGVGLSLGGEAALDDAHLDRIAALVRRYEPAVFSEHLAWSTHGGIFFNDLLPIAYDEDTLERACRHVAQVQERLARRILVENPSTYVELAASTMSEQAFLSELVRRSGCGLLLDVSNVLVSCANHDRDVDGYLAGLPLDHVGEVHLAGYAVETDADGRPLLIDTHDRPVAQPAWALYEALLPRLGPVATLVEWDNELPDYATLQEQAVRAQRCIDGLRPAARAA